jgi:hypothetical protein
VDRLHRFFSPLELLAEFPAGAHFVEDRKAALAARICLPRLWSRAAAWKLLAVQVVLGAL